MGRVNVGQKILFIGLGSIGQRHLRCAKRVFLGADFGAVRSKSGMGVVLDQNNCVLGEKDIATHYSLSEWSSIELALAEFVPDIVFVCNPSSCHFDAIRLALESDAFVFAEKPVVTNLADLEILRDLERATGKKRVFVGFQTRYHPVCAKVRELLSDTSIIGDVISSRFVNAEYIGDWHPYENYALSYASRSDLGGGALLTQIHDFDLAHAFLGEVSLVAAIGGKLSPLEGDVEDVASVLCSIKAKDKKYPCSFHFNYLQWPPEKSWILQFDFGTVHIDFLTPRVSISDYRSRQKTEMHFESFSRDGLFMDQMRAFKDFIESGAGLIVGLDEAAASLQLAIGAREKLGYV